MKTKQILLISALVLFAASVLWAPWMNRYGRAFHVPLFSGGNDLRLQWAVLLCQWLAIGLFHLGLWHLLKSVAWTRTLAIKAGCATAIAVVVLWAIALRIANEMP